MTQPDTQPSAPLRETAYYSFESVLRQLDTITREANQVAEIASPNTRDILNICVTAAGELRGATSYLRAHLRLGLLRVRSTWSVDIFSVSARLNIIAERLHSIGASIHQAVTRYQVSVFERHNDNSITASQYHFFCDGYHIDVATRTFWQAEEALAEQLTATHTTLNMIRTLQLMIITAVVTAFLTLLLSL